MINTHHTLLLIHTHGTVATRRRNARTSNYIRVLVFEDFEGSLGFPGPWFATGEEEVHLFKGPLV